MKEGEDYWGRRRQDASENEGDFEDSPRKDKDAVKGSMILEENLMNALSSFCIIVNRIQQEVKRVVSQANNSEKELLRIIGFETYGLLRGRMKARNAMNAIATVCRIETDDDFRGKVIRSVAEIHFHDGGDKFRVSLLKMEDILTKRKIKIFLNAGLIDEEMHRDMWHGIDNNQIGVERILEGDIIENKEPSSYESKSAIERLAGIPFATTTRLPIGVKMAKVTRISSSNELRWECLENPDRWGWVHRSGVRIAITTREDVLDDNEWGGYSL